MSLPTPYYHDPRAGITIYHGDCREIVLDTSKSFAVVTDPPYGTGGWRREVSGGGRNPAASLVREAWDDGDYGWIASYREAEAIVTFAPAARTFEALDAARTSGFNKHRAIYMQKRDPKPMPGGRVRWSMEPIWVLSRDGFVLLGATDCFAASTPRVGRDSDATGHPYEKPLEVMVWLLGMLPGDLTILDPFMGSGTTLRAAADLGRRAIGIEINEDYCRIAVERLRQGVLL